MGLNDSLTPNLHGALKQKRIPDCNGDEVDRLGSSVKYLVAIRRTEQTIPSSGFVADRLRRLQERVTYISEGYLGPKAIVNSKGGSLV